MAAAFFFKLNIIQRIIVDYLINLLKCLNGWQCDPVWNLLRLEMP